MFYCGACLGMSDQICFMKLRVATQQLSERFRIEESSRHTRMRKSAASDHACKWICSTRHRILHLTVVNMNSVVCRFNINPVVDYFNRAVNMGKFVISHGAAWLSDKALFHLTRVTCKHCSEQNDGLR